MTHGESVRASARSPRARALGVDVLAAVGLRERGYLTPQRLSDGVVFGAVLAALGGEPFDIVELAERAEGASQHRGVGRERSRHAADAKVLAVEPQAVGLGARVSCDAFDVGHVCVGDALAGDSRSCSSASRRRLAPRRSCRSSPGRSPGRAGPRDAGPPRVRLDHRKRLPRRAGGRR